MIICTIVEKVRSNERMLYSFQLLSLGCMILTVQIWQLHGFGRISDVFFLLGAVLSLFCSGCLMTRSINSTLLRNIIYGFTLEVFALIILSGSIGSENSLLEKFSLLQKNSFIFLCISLVILAGVHAFQLGYAVRSFHFKQVDRANVLCLAICICILVGIGLQFLNLWPRWDSYPYYFDLEQQISVQNIFGIDGGRLKVCGHSCGAFALLSLLFRKIPGVSLINTIYLSNIFLLIVVFFLIYLIFKRTFHFKCVYLYSIAAFVFVCSPYILGTAFSINPEHLALTGILMFLFGAIRSDYFLCIIACYIMCNTRETCVFIAALLIVVQFMYDAHNNFKREHNLYSIEWIYYGSVFMIGITWLLDFQTKNWKDGMYAQRNYFYNDGRAAFTFGFDWLYIFNQFKGIFLTNFTWVYTAIIIVFLFLFIKQNKKIVLVKNKLCVMLLCSIFAALFGECVFLTHHNYRYYTAVVSMISMLALYCTIYTISKVTIKESLKCIPIVIIGIIMLAQCYITIDPIMLSVFPSINTGRGRIAFMPWHMNNLSGPEFLDNANYNFQSLTFDKALDMVYASIELEDSRVLIYDGYQWGDLGNTLNSIWGYGYEFRIPPAWGVWNEEGQYRELSHNPDPEDIINPIPVSDFLSVEENLEKYDTLYYIELPWGDVFVEQLKEHYPTMQLYKTVDYQTWVLNIYSIQ